MATGKISAMQSREMGHRLLASAQASRHVLADRKGVVTLEFAIVGTLFLLLLIGIVEVGRGLWTVNALNYAVQQAARCASVNSTDCSTQDNVRSFAMGVSAAQVPNTIFTLSQYSDYTCSTSTATASQVKAKMVSASYAMKLYIPFVSTQPTLVASSCFPVK